MLTREEKLERRHIAMRKHFSDPAQLHKQTARRALGHAVRIGKIVPPATCEKCGAGNPEGHHEDYSKPFDVKWLCRPCHGLEHRNRKTHCNHGHELTPESTYPTAGGKRRCRQCRYNSVQKHYDTKGKFERKAELDTARALLAVEIAPEIIAESAV